MQAESYNAHLRSISEVFSPKIKQIAPPDAYQKNVAMNAALALNWARLSGSRLCLLPYESTGSRMKAESSRMKGSSALNSSFFRLPFPAIRRAFHHDLRGDMNRESLDWTQTNSSNRISELNNMRPK
jgi:hypothetical protein